MPRTSPVLFPGTSRLLSALGERVRLARLRRRYSAVDVSARAGVTRSTLYRVEQGDAGVSIGTYASVLKVLGLHNDLDGLAKDDALGRKLQDLNLPVRRTARRSRKTSKPESASAPVENPPRPSHE